MFTIYGNYNKADIFIDQIDDATRQQVETLCNQEWVQGSHIAIMPDCHAGAGCVIGFTMTIQDKICPNLVGVDIGCGMLCIRLPEELKILSLEKLDTFINTQIPSGFDVYEERQYNPISTSLQLEKLHCFKHLKNVDYLERSVGTLGGGNHFIELDKSDAGDLYLVIHSGSRNLGKQVAEYYQELAYEDCNHHKENVRKQKQELIDRLKKEGREKEIQRELEKLKPGISPDILPKDLCYLTGAHMQDYLEDMRVCQKYARENRRLIAQKILEHLFLELYPYSSGAVWVEENEAGYEDEHIDIRMECFTTMHNYVNFNDNILRKGAISCHEGEKVLIPLNMRDGAIIAIGKGNPETNYSGPHGAGRLMSRSEATQKVSLEKYQETMKDIYSTSVDESTLDESPMAYKSMDTILKHIGSMVNIQEIIHPIYNFKAHKKEKKEGEIYE